MKIPLKLCDIFSMENITVADAVLGCLTGVRMI
jgi:hypothetical protein